MMPLLRYAFAEGVKVPVLVAGASGNSFPMPTGLKEFFGTEVVDGDSHRPGRCYELSTFALADSPAGTVLVHGSIHGRGGLNGKPFERIGHAWLVVREYGLVWEPYHAMLYDEGEWYEWTRAIGEHIFSKATVSQLLVEHGHTGPWFPTRYR